MDKKKAVEYGARMYLLGFKSSGEGYNGEYPFDDDMREIEVSLGARAKRSANSAYPKAAQ